MSRRLSGYRLMWLMVMFDLPVETSEDRKAGSDFRKALLDFGFERCQYSIYLRFSRSYTESANWVKRVRSVLPGGGKVYCLRFTDKQYEGIVRFENSKRLSALSNPKQFLLI